MGSEGRRKNVTISKNLYIHRSMQQIQSSIRSVNTHGLGNNPLYSYHHNHTSLEQETETCKTTRNTNRLQTQFSTPPPTSMVICILPDDSATTFGNVGNSSTIGIMSTPLSTPTHHENKKYPHISNNTYISMHNSRHDAPTKMTPRWSG